MKHNNLSLGGKGQQQAGGDDGGAYESSYADDIIDPDTDVIYLSNGQFNADSSAHDSTPILQNTFDDDGSSIFGPFRKSIRSFSVSR